jgi:hypothetical protein
MGLLRHLGTVVIGAGDMDARMREIHGDIEPSPGPVHHRE